MSNSEGLLIYESQYETFKDFLEDGDEDLALEYIKALMEYSFEGKEYSGRNREIKRLLNTDCVIIDNQRVRYGKAVKGGRVQKVSDDEIVEALDNNHFNSITEAARYIAVNYTSDGKFTQQALSKRLKAMGVDFAAYSSRKVKSVEKTEEKIEENTTVCPLPSSPVYSNCFDTKDGYISTLIRDGNSRSVVVKEIAKRENLAEWQAENRFDDVINILKNAR